MNKSTQTALMEWWNCLSKKHTVMLNSLLKTKIMKLFWANLKMEGSEVSLHPWCHVITAGRGEESWRSRRSERRAGGKEMEGATCNKSLPLFRLSRPVSVSASSSKCSWWLFLSLCAVYSQASAFPTGRSMSAWGGLHFIECHVKQERASRFSMAHASIIMEICTLMMACAHPSCSARVQAALDRTAVPLIHSFKVTSEPFVQRSEGPAWGGCSSCNSSVIQAKIAAI